MISSESKLNLSQKSYSISVALIIPFYNGSEFFDFAIESALNQTRPYDEIIVVNDGSSEIESDWLRLHPCIGSFRLIEGKNGGQGSARNAGVIAAKSDYICFLDQDDFLYPEHAERLVCAMNSLRQPHGWVYGNFSTCDSMGHIISRMSYPNVTMRQPLDLISFLSHDLFMLPSATIFCKKAFLSIGGFDTQFRGYEDDDLFVRLFMAGFSYAYLEEEVYVWRMHGKQTSSTLTMCESRLKFVKKWGNINISDISSKNMITVGLYRRFIYFVLADFYLSKDNEYLNLRKKILIEYLKFFFDKFSGIIKFKVKMLQTIIKFTPRSFGTFFLTAPLARKLTKIISKAFR